MDLREIRAAGTVASVPGYYFHDAHGNVTRIANTGGTVTHAYLYDAFGNQLNTNEDDSNPFRYCGEYYDSETGNYYLRARYYDPTVGRFTQSDSVRYVHKELPNGVSVVDPRSLNLYAYCANNPVMYGDPTGHAWETILDIAGIVWSAVDFAKDPSLANLAFFAWDVGAALIPFVPGSYMAKGGKLAVRALGKTDDVIDAFKALSKTDLIKAIGDGNIVMPYKQLKKLAKGLGYEVHHLIEKRFADALGLNANDILSIAIDKNTHRKITSAMRDMIGYSRDLSKPVRTNNATIKQIWQCLYDVYKGQNMDEYIPILKEYILENSTKKAEIMKELGW